jgi:hypothetical protein
MTPLELRAPRLRGSKRPSSMPERYEGKLLLGLLSGSLACLVLSLGLCVGPVQDERPVYLLRAMSERTEESQTQLKAGSFTACQVLCDKEALCIAVTHDPGLDFDCVLHILGPTRHKRTWVKAGSRSQIAALVFAVLSALGIASSVLASVYSICSRCAHHECNTNC